MSGQPRKIRIGFLTVDAREAFREYERAEPYFGTAPEALLQGFALLPDVEVHVVCCVQRPVGSPTKLASNIWYHSLLVPKMGWMRTGYQGCIRATRKKLKELQPDIVHGQGTERDCAISAVLSGYPNVLTIHGNIRLIAKVNNARPFSFNWLAARLEGFTVPRSLGIICITHYTQAAVADSGRRTWVVPNAVDSSFFSIEAQPQPAPPQILCVGHICLRKNQNAFIRALDAIAQRQKFELIFLGQSVAGRPYDDEFFALVRERPWCRYGGLASREELKKYLRGATLLALPSLEDNCPMVLLEAMAAGVPVVAAKVGGIPDLVEEGETGWFCDPLDETSMRQVIEKALGNFSTAREVAKQAKQRARARFHPEVIARRHLEIYEEVLRSDS